MDTRPTTVVSSSTTTTPRTRSGNSSNWVTSPILGEVIGEKHNFDAHDFTTKWCRAYGRDRGEKGTKARKHKTVKEACSSFDNDYAYLFIVAENRWTFREGDGPFRPLTTEACK